MRLSNHKPGSLDAGLADVPVTGTFDPGATFAKIIEDACYQPLVPGTDVHVQVNGTEITPADMAATIWSTMFADNVDVSMEATAQSLLAGTLVHYDATAPMSADDMFCIQAAVSEKMDFPDSMTIYSAATDVIPAAKEFLAGNISADAWLANIAFMARPCLLGASFADEAAFDRFKAWLDAQVQPIAAALPPETVRLFTEFQKLSLGELTESLWLRKDLSDNNDDMSFARMLPHYMVTYAKVEQPPLYALMPFSASQLLLPEAVVFINVSMHAHASPKAVSDEWKTITKSLAMPVRIVNNKQLSKLTGAARAAQKMAGAAATAHQQQPIVKSANVPFRKTAPTAVDMFKLVNKVLAKMSAVARSQNSYKDVHRSYMRASRRNPDDYNIPGKSVTTKYKPDIHLYVDTSGSISERNYQDAVKACIQLARKLDVNVYFNSFSHVLSQCTLMQTKGRSAKQVYRQFQKVPKVGGGTDYEQIWNYIQASPKRKRELSLIVTDFEYTAPKRFVKHPRNLYYVACSNMSWSRILSDARDFCVSMRHIDPDIRSHLLL